MEEELALPAVRYVAKARAWMPSCGSNGHRWACWRKEECEYVCAKCGRWTRDPEKGSDRNTHESYRELAESPKTAAWNCVLL